MLQYLIQCEGCGVEIVGAEKGAVVPAVLEHLRTTHPAMAYPSPALDMVRVMEVTRLEYPSQGEQLKAGIPSQALARLGEAQPAVSLDVPKPEDITF